MSLKADLVERLNTGNESAIRDTLDCFLPYFKRVAKRRKTPDLESEFWMRCFLQLKGGGQQFDSPESVSAFIKLVCRGTAANYTRHDRLVTLPSKLHRLGIKTREVTDYEFVSQGDDTDARDALYLCCENDLQRAILARRMAGQSVIEIAEILEIPRSTVYFHLKGIRDRYGEI